MWSKRGRSLFHKQGLHPSDRGISSKNLDQMRRNGGKGSCRISDDYCDEPNEARRKRRCLATNIHEQAKASVFPIDEEYTSSFDEEDDSIHVDAIFERDQNFINDKKDHIFNPQSLHNSNNGVPQT